ncbi:hypothetical protein [Undibacterium sp.]|uniref:hypothetical protein n=1 Tax=Undibacterium sp. TaxID=1914977 RepID=UPI002B51B920|nr:hypothetical protein [Undibacterium sp.]HTD05153.1 hypothetical protein [Undibacterium sp.]
MHDKKWETDETRCAQTTSVSDPFPVKHKMLRPQRIKVKSNVKNNPNIKIKINPTNFVEQVLFHIGESGCSCFSTLSLTFNRLEPRRLCGTENGSEMAVV